MKETWKNINNFLGRGKNKNFSYPKQFKMGETIFDSMDKIVNGFNDYFTDIGEQLQAKYHLIKGQFIIFWIPRNLIYLNSD